MFVVYGKKLKKEIGKYFTIYLIENLREKTWIYYILDKIFCVLARIEKVNLI